MKKKFLCFFVALFSLMSVYSRTDAVPYYYTFEEVQKLMDSLVTNFPSISSKELIGNSLNGNPIYALKISGDVIHQRARPKVLFEGCIHGDEQTATATLCNFARELCRKYATMTRVQNVVNNTEIWIIPIVNPDGYIGNTRMNENRVDLNRDASYMWTGYYGASTGMCLQPESKLMRNFLIKHQFTLMIDYHSGIQGIVYPWCYRAEATPDNAEFASLANNYKAVSGYSSDEFESSSCYSLYYASGSVIEFAYGCLGTLAYSVELFSGFSGDGVQGLTLNREPMLMMIENASYGLKGTVTDAVTHKPIEAVIKVTGKMPVYSDCFTGFYSKYLLPGIYSVTISANGYEGVIKGVNVSNNSSTLLDVALNPKSANQSAFKLLAVKSIADGDSPSDPLKTWNVIGRPDNDYYAMGNAGYVILDMGKNIVNVAGNDITITGTSSSSGNGYKVYCSDSPDGMWNLLGSAIGTQSFELGDLNNIRYLKVEDNGIGISKVLNAGFHLDAVTFATTTTNIPDIVNKQSFTLYPNPTTSHLNINSDKIINTIKIYDIHGNNMLTYNNINSNYCSLNIIQLPVGIYFIKVNNSVVNKFIKN